jgi:hypothetical protein
VTDDELRDVARSVFHARSSVEVGAAVAGVPDWQLGRVAELASEMHARRVEFVAAADDMIAEHGYLVQAVMGDTTSPWFAYTAGLYPKYPAEIIARGFGEATSDVVYAAVHRLKRGEIGLVPGDYTLPDGGAVRIVPWAGSAGDVAQARRHHHGRGCHTFPVMHILLPDSVGRLPGDPGCAIAYHQLRGIEGTPQQ